MLHIADLNVYYGAIHALKGVTLSVEEGEIVTLIGANGVGKSTTLRAISGLAPPRSGRIDLQGRDLTRLRAHQIATSGVAHAPEGRRIFPNLTVHENLDLGAYARRDRAEIERDFAEVLELFPRLKERLRQPAGTLSGGEQQMLAIGRALMSSPKLLLLDEPSMGLAPVLVERIFDIIKEINHQGTTILLVEQNANVALEIATRGYVLESGNIVNAAPAEKLRQDPKVREAYLGEI